MRPLLTILALVFTANAAAEDKITRVFHLQKLQPREALTLLRTEVQVRQVAMVFGRELIVVSDAAERVGRSEELLRERGAVTRVSTPHGPLDLEKLADTEPTSRTLAVGKESAPIATTLLRTIYQMNEVTEVDGGITVRAAAPVLDAAEALLKELGLMRA